MFIGHFTERPYQDPDSGVFGATGRAIPDLGIGNEVYNPRVARSCTTATSTSASTRRRWASMA